MPLPCENGWHHVKDSRYPRTKTSRTKEQSQQPYGTARASSKHALSAVPTLAAAPAAATVRGAAPAARSASAAAAAAAAVSTPNASKSTPERPGQWVRQFGLTSAY